MNTQTTTVASASFEKERPRRCVDRACVSVKSLSSLSSSFDSMDGDVSSIADTVNAIVTTERNDEVTVEKERRRRRRRRLLPPKGKEEASSTVSAPFPFFATFVLLAVAATTVVIAYNKTSYDNCDLFYSFTRMYSYSHSSLSSITPSKLEARVWNEFRFYPFATGGDGVLVGSNRVDDKSESDGEITSVVVEYDEADDGLGDKEGNGAVHGQDGGGGDSDDSEGAIDLTEKSDSSSSIKNEEEKNKKWNTSDDHSGSDRSDDNDDDDDEDDHYAVGNSTSAGALRNENDISPDEGARDTNESVDDNSRKNKKERNKSDDLSWFVGSDNDRDSVFGGGTGDENGDERKEKKRRERKERRKEEREKRTKSDDWSGDGDGDRDESSANEKRKKSDDWIGDYGKSEAKERKSKERKEQTRSGDGGDELDNSNGKYDYPANNSTSLGEQYVGNDTVVPGSDGDGGDVGIGVDSGGGNYTIAERGSADSRHDESGGDGGGYKEDQEDIPPPGSSVNIWDEGEGEGDDVDVRVGATDEYEHEEGRGDIISGMTTATAIATTGSSSSSAVICERNYSRIRPVRYVYVVEIDPDAVAYDDYFAKAVGKDPLSRVPLSADAGLMSRVVEFLEAVFLQTLAEELLPCNGQYTEMEASRVGGGSGDSDGGGTLRGFTSNASSRDENGPLEGAVGIGRGGRGHIKDIYVCKPQIDILHQCAIVESVVVAYLTNKADVNTAFNRIRSILSRSMSDGGCGGSDQPSRCYLRPSMAKMGLVRIEYKGTISADEGELMDEEEKTKTEEKHPMDGGGIEGGSEVDSRPNKIPNRLTWIVPAIVILSSIGATLACVILGVIYLRVRRRLKIKREGGGRTNIWYISGSDDEDSVSWAGQTVVKAEQWVEARLDMAPAGWLGAEKSSVADAVAIDCGRSEHRVEDKCIGEERTKDCLEDINEAAPTASSSFITSTTSSDSIPLPSDAYGELHQICEEEEETSLDSK